MAAIADRGVSLAITRRVLPVWVVACLPFPWHLCPLRPPTAPESGSLMTWKYSSRHGCRACCCCWCRCCCCRRVRCPCDCCCCSTMMRELKANNPSRSRNHQSRGQFSYHFPLWPVESQMQAVPRPRHSQHHSTSSADDNLILSHGFRIHCSTARCHHLQHSSGRRDQLRLTLIAGAIISDAEPCPPAQHRDVGEK
jgi:hypothetical protein